MFLSKLKNFFKPKENSTSLPLDPTPDFPQKFGEDMQWYVVKSNNIEAVTKSLKLKDSQKTNWQSGLYSISNINKAIFITPSINGWIFIISWSLPSFEREGGEEVKALLDKFAKEFGEAQYFVNYKNNGYYGWGTQKGSEFIRGFGYYGDADNVLWGEDNEAPRKPNAKDVLERAEKWSLNPTKLNDAPYQKEKGVGHIGFIDY